MVDQNSMRTWRIWSLQGICLHRKHLWRCLKTSTFQALIYVHKWDSDQPLIKEFDAWFLAWVIRITCAKWNRQFDLFKAIVYFDSNSEGDLKRQLFKLWFTRAHGFLINPPMKIRVRRIVCILEPSVRDKCIGRLCSRCSSVNSSKKSSWHSLMQWCGSGRIRIHLDQWIRIQGWYLKDGLKSI